MKLGRRAKRVGSVAASVIMVMGFFLVANEYCKGIVIEDVEQDGKMIEEDVTRADFLGCHQKITIFDENGDVDTTGFALYDGDVFQMNFSTSDGGSFLIRIMPDGTVKNDDTVVTDADEIQQDRASRGDFDNSCALAGAKRPFWFRRDLPAAAPAPGSSI